MSNENEFAGKIVDEVYNNRLLQEAASHYRAKRYKEALDAYEEVIQLDPNNAAAYAGKGDCLRLLEQNEQALHAYKQAITIDPDNISAHNGIGYTFLKLKDYHNASLAYQNAIRLSPKSASAYNIEGMILYSQSRFEGALQAFEEAIRLATEANIIAVFYNNKGTALRELRRYPDALDAFVQALQIDPEDSKFRDNILSISREEREKKVSQFCDSAEKLSSQYRFKEALQMFDKALQIDSNHIRPYIGRGNALLYCHNCEEALITFNKILQISSECVQALIGKGKTLHEMKRYDQSLATFNLALQLDNQLSQAHVGKGHTLFELNRSMDALKCYGEAIDLNTDDVSCYVAVGDILLDLRFYEEVIQMYDRAFQFISGLIPIYPEDKNEQVESNWYSQLLTACKEIIKQGSTNIATYLSILDMLSYFGLREEASQAFDNALNLALKKNEQDISLLWSLIGHAATTNRPAYVQFELLQRYIANAPAATQREEALKHIGGLYPELFDTGDISSAIFQYHLQILHSILYCFTEGEQAKALTLVANGDDIRIVQLLIILAPFSLPGLKSLARQVTLRWVPTPRDDDLVINFYQTLDSYSVSFENSDYLFAQQLMLEKQYLRAKTLLSNLVKRISTPDYLWLLATVMWRRQDPAQEQIEVLRQFITSTVSFDARCGEAWKHLGDLALENSNGIVAIEAFQKAERYGYVIPLLESFRTNNWDAIPGLHQHPDCVFPPVVVLDLESDYQPDATPGSCVFEIAAVRMKGSTELATFNVVIRCNFISPKVAQRQIEAIEPEQAVRTLQEFIGTSIVIGHNLQAFDVIHLRAMGLIISDDQIIDTLTFARWLYPDSVHHNLALLCHEHHISFQGDQHTALPDARACANLLHALGDELMRRNPRLLAGFRAFVPPESAFDRVVLQPRGVAADPTLFWDLDPMPTKPHVLTSVQPALASPGILEALERNIDALVERYDPSGTYVQHLTTGQRVVVLVNSRARLERMLVLSQEHLDPFVLPDLHSLLCPDRLRHCIEQTQSWQMKLTLFCLYQASHNHDVRTLYPMRLPSEDQSLNELRQILIASCCTSDYHHPVSCPGTLAVQDATKQHCVVLATHESYLHQRYLPEADVIIVDDADKLQMYFAEYLAERITSNQVQVRSPEVFKLLNEQIVRYVKEHVSNPAFYECIPLRNIIPYLTQPHYSNSNSLLFRLKTMDYIGEEIASRLEELCHQAQLEEITLNSKIHAYWLELRVVRQPNNMTWSIEQWSFCGISESLQQAFHDLFCKPYKQHIFCGTAITLGALGTEFLTRFFGLPENIEFLADQRPASCVYIPPREVIRPASFLARRAWAMSASTFLYQLTKVGQQSLIVSLQAMPIANALAETFQELQSQVGHQVLSPRFGWTTAKIAERLTDTGRQTIILITPRMRETILDIPVDIEATGPLRFLNQQDPLVAAHLRLFARAYENENPFSSYLLPQALLELKTRISSPAKVHIILDSGLHSKVYRDEVCSLFQQDTMLDVLPGISGESQISMDAFSTALGAALERWGLSSRTSVDDETLHLVLQTFWGTGSFRKTPLNQKDIVQKVLDGKDQLVIAATGGGKSLCFQLPAILMAQDHVPKVTLVISPLLALMKDQVEALRKNGVFSAIAWNSNLSFPDRQNYLEGIKGGWYSIIYIAPEQIRTSSLRKALEAREVGLIAIDEAHCVSQWGHKFRTDYFALRNWVETQLCDRRRREFPIIAMTATAREGHVDSATGAIEQGTVQDIIEGLGLRPNEDVMITSLERPELEFCVEQITVPCANCQYPLIMDTGMVKCSSCGCWCEIEEEKIKHAKVERLISLLAERSEQGLRQRWDKPCYRQRQRGLIYCTYTKTTKEIAEALRTDSRLTGLRIAEYHGKMPDPDEALTRVYNAFTSDDKDGVDIVVATNAFGMGIDVRRLGFVIHFDIPGTLEAYIQEAGRAGRDSKFKQDGEHARCVLLYHEYDLRKQRYLSSQNTITEQEIVDVYEVLRKCRSNGEQEIFVTVDEIEFLTGVGESKSKSILFYLERHTRVNGKSLLERGENAQTKWLLAFEHGYEDRIQDPAINASSLQLIDQFLTSDEFRLREREIRVIDGDDLADSLEWQRSTLLNEINNLARRNILAHANRLYIRWSKSKTEACQLITQLEQDFINLLRNVPDQQSLSEGKRVVIDIEALYNESKLTAVPIHTFTHLLSALSKSNIGAWQLFEHFGRANSGYELQLIPIEQVKSTRKDFFQQLQQITQRYASTQRSDAWQVLDMLTEEADHEQRSQLEQRLLLLEKIELLSLKSMRDKDSTMRIIFKNDDVPEDQLEIDLSRLRLVERYGERKLELMKDYATMPSEQRMLMLNAYFAGKSPLLEPFKWRSNLSEQQRDIAAISEGYHLVEGPAGSGKTVCLEEHVRYLVEHELVPQDHILVVTHYNGSVDRISNNVNVYQKKGKTIPAKTLNKLGKRIFLQNCELLLRPDGQPYYAEKKELRLLDGSSQEELSLVQEVLARMRQEGQYANRRYPETSNANRCLKGIKRLSHLGIFSTLQFDPEMVRRVLESYSQDWVDFLCIVYCQYLDLRGERGIYTYDDQILFALAILQAHPDIAKTYQRFYEQIIVDEFQDLTIAQAKLIGILSQKHRNIMAFGDDAQDIRDKEDDDRMPSPLVRRFQWLSSNKLPTPHYLTTNFRSVQEILDLAGAIRDDDSILVQVADRGLRGEKPAAIRVINNDISTSNKSERDILRAMVDAALYQRSLLPPSDTGSVVLMVALARLSYIVENYLKEQQVPFSLLKHTHFQSWHVGQVLTYYRLIVDKHQDSEVARLLYYCVSPQQVRYLKGISQKNGQPLFDILVDSDILMQMDIPPEEKEALRQHLAIIHNSGPESRFAEVWNAISELPDGPLALTTGEAQGKEELDAVLEEFKNNTVAEAMEHINHHIAFLEENDSDRQLIVTTIDNAKSQAFDTVFLLGAHLLKMRQRWYVSVSRARERFFFLVDGQSFENQEDDAFISWVPRELYDELSWP